MAASVIVSEYLIAGWLMKSIYRFAAEWLSESLADGCLSRRIGCRKPSMRSSSSWKLESEGRHT
jgi:hypothetical protein